MQQACPLNNAYGGCDRAEPGLIASQTKGIFSPFCLFFCVCHQMRTEAMVAEGIVVTLATRISPSRKNLKSSMMKAFGG